MKRLLLIAVAMLAFAGAAPAQDLSGQDGSIQEQTYRLNGKPVRVWTDDKMDVEMRFIPGWQLQCRQAQWGSDDCPGGGQGYLFFTGRASGEATFDGQARTDRCPEMFPAYADFDKRGRLTIYQVNAKGAVMRNSKCNVVLIPAKDPIR